MPKVRPLTPLEARRSIANRLAPTVDRIRQLNTKLGERPHRVFLTWTRWTGEARGEGAEELVGQLEVLPTPRVDSLDSVSFSMFSGGTLPVGSIRVSEISVATFTEDLLCGRRIPDEARCCRDVPDERGAVVPHTAPIDGRSEEVPFPFDFFYEVVEDGRGDPHPVRNRFRLLSKPFRRAGKVDWMIMLEREDPDRERDNRSPFAGPGRR